MSELDYVYKLLDQVYDPEVPVLTIRDLGVVRRVELTGSVVEVDITPTYSGCPAMDTIEQDIKQIFLKNNLKVKVQLIYKEAWTTDWISENGKKKLLEYGIAPPNKKIKNKKSLLGEFESVICPRCKSKNTELISQFGSTACKALFKCKDCLEPFDYFKCL